MGSWWRRYAELLGLTIGHGSWPRRAASLFAPSETSWHRTNAENIGVIGTSGSWDRRFAEDNDGTGSWIRHFVENAAILEYEAGDANTAIQAAFSASNVVIVEAGTYESDAFEIPEGKTLVLHPDATLKISDTSTATQAVTFSGDNASLIGGTIDVNIPDRETNESFTNYSHGILLRNVSNCLVSSVNIINAGDTTSYVNLSGCGILIDRDDNAVADTANCTIRNVTIADDNLILPFGIRVRSEITDYATGEYGFDCKNHLVDGFTITGTIKNGVEVVGPDTNHVIVRNGTLANWQGQGGMEADFGSSAVLFEDCAVSLPGMTGTPDRSVAFFSARTSDVGDDKPKNCNDITFRNCRATDAVSSGSYYVYGFDVIGASNVAIDNCHTSSFARGNGANDDRIVGLSIDTDFSALHDIVVTNPDWSDLDIGVRYYGTEGLSDLLFYGGTINARKYGYRKATSTPASSIWLLEGLHLTAVTPVSCTDEGEGVLNIEDCKLSGVNITLPSTPANANILRTEIELQPLGTAQLLAANSALDDEVFGNTFSVFDPAEAYLLRCFAKPVSSAELAIRNLFSDLGSLVYDLDGIIGMVGFDEQSAMLNMVQARYNATETGTTSVWTAYTGLSGCDASNYWDTNFNPTTAVTPKFVQDDSFMVLLKDAGSSVSTRFGNNNARCFSANGPIVNTRANDGTSTQQNTSPTDWEACWWNRTGSASYKRGYDAVALSDVAVASTALTNANFGIGKLGGATSDATGVHRLVAWGKSLSDSNRATVVSALRTYSAAMRALA